MVYNYILKKLEVENIKTIIEVGGRYGNESVDLAKDYPKAKIHTFECNPKTIDQCRAMCEPIDNITFNAVGVSEHGKTLPFYSYVMNNDGCSSFYKRFDGMQTMIYAGELKTITLNDYMKNKNIKEVDCLCLDTQGSELDIIKGCRESIVNIRYIILEQPNEIPNPHYMPPRADGKGFSHSKYIDAPEAHEIKNYLADFGFKEIYRTKENEIENNVVYSNVK